MVHQQGGIADLGDRFDEQNGFLGSLGTLYRALDFDGATAIVARHPKPQQGKSGGANGSHRSSIFHEANCACDMRREKEEEKGLFTPLLMTYSSGLILIKLVGQAKTPIDV